MRLSRVIAADPKCGKLRGARPGILGHHIKLPARNARHVVFLGPSSSNGAAGLRLLSHHKVGRHSVASQAVTSGESVKAVQAQLRHRSEQSTHQYAHLGSGAQRRLVEALKPVRAPHEEASLNGHGNVVATGTQSASEAAE